MVDSYENLEGKIWLDGELVEWKDAKFHLLTHALHYGSSVFEGERAYGGKIYKSYEHSERLKKSAEYVDMQVPYSTDELEIAKRKVLDANRQKDAYVRAVAWRGSGPDMGVASSRNPVRVAIASWKWGAYYGDAKMKGAKLDISDWKRPSPVLPCTCSAVTNFLSSGVALPLNTGTSNTPLSSHIFNALTEVKSSGTFPATHVTPKTSSCSFAPNAVINANASS